MPVPFPWLSIVVPVRATTPDDFRRTTEHWHSVPLADLQVELIFVDDSGAPLAALNRALIPPDIQHVVVEQRERGPLNGKVNSLRVGLEAVRASRVMILDDDARPSAQDIRQVLAQAPDNVLRIRAWPTRLSVTQSIESARALLSDFLRQGGETSPLITGPSRVLRTALNGINGDLLFDDRVLEDYFALQGTRLRTICDLCIPRANPSVQRWLEQQVRYAYEDLALVAKSVTLATWPLPAVTLIVDGFAQAIPVAVAIACCCTMLAALGRRRAGLEQRCPAWVPLFSPLWLIVRTLAIPIALSLRLAGGCSYGGRRIKGSANVRLWGW